MDGEIVENTTSITNTLVSYTGVESVKVSGYKVNVLFTRAKNYFKDFYLVLNGNKIVLWEQTVLGDGAPPPAILEAEDYEFFIGTGTNVLEIGYTEW